MNLFWSAFKKYLYDPYYLFGTREYTHIFLFTKIYLESQHKQWHYLNDFLQSILLVFLNDLDRLYCISTIISPFCPFSVRDEWAFLNITLCKKLFTWLTCFPFKVTIQIWLKYILTLDRKIIKLHGACINYTLNYEDRLIRTSVTSFTMSSFC